MSRAHLLLVDSDPKSLQLLEVSLRKVGFQVTTSADGRDALGKAALLGPDLVLCDVSLPGLDGFALLAALRDEPRTVGVPVVFLSENANVEERVRALGAGAADYLSKPIYIKEIVARIRIHLQASERQRQLATPSSEREGSLGDMGLVDLLHTLSGQTGLVSCVGFRGESGLVWVDEGRVVDAQVGRLEGEAAFQKLLTWPDGVWRYRQGKSERTPRITRPLGDLLVDGLAHLDAWQRELDRLPGLDAVYEVDFGVLSTRLASVPDEVNAVLRLLDGRRAIRQLVEDSVFDGPTTLAILNRLVVERFIRIVPVLPQVSPVLRALEDWVSPTTHSIPDVRLEPSPVESQTETSSVDETPEVTPTPVWDPALEAASFASNELETSDGEANLWAGNPGEDEDEAPPALDLASSSDVPAEIVSEEPWRDESATIPVMRYPSRLGARRERLELEALEAAAQAEARGENPIVLTDEVLAPGEQADEALVAEVEAQATSPFEEPRADEAPAQDLFSVSTEPELPLVPEVDPTFIDTPAETETRPTDGELDDDELALAFGKKGKSPAAIVIAVVAVVAAGVIFMMASGSGDEPTVVDAKVEKAQAAPVVVKTVETPSEKAASPEAIVEAAPEPILEPEPIPEPAPAPRPQAAEPVVVKPAPTPAEQMAELVDSTLAAARRENWPQVASLARRVLKLEPNHPVALRELGKAQYNANNLSDARTTLVHATRVAPRDADAFMYLGIVCQELDRTDEARNAYLRFQELEPKSSARYRDISAVLENMGR